MPRQRRCDFCESDIEPGTGTVFVRVDGTTIDFCSSKCEKNADLGRESRDLEWTGRDEEPEDETGDETEDTEAVADADTVETEEADDEADVQADENADTAETEEADDEADADDEAENPEAQT